MGKILALVLAISILGNIFLYSQLQGKSAVKEIGHEDLPYLSKRIFVENQNDILINFIPLRRALREYVEKPENKVGVYFEYLPSGTSIGANEKEEVVLVSLSKVPLAIVGFSVGKTTSWPALATKSSASFNNRVENFHKFNLL